MTIIKDQQVLELADLIDQPQQANRTFWTAKAFHGYISEAYQIECSYETVVRFFHKQGYALKMPHGIEKCRPNGMDGNQSICHHIQQI